MGERRPTINREAALAAMAKIDAADLATVTIDALVEMLTPVFTGYRVPVPKFEAGVRLYRARRYDKPQRLDELWYPHESNVGLGRANREHMPMLYCSTAREAPFFELRCNLGQMVAVVELETTQKMLLNNVGYTKTTFDQLGSSRQPGWGPIQGERVDEPDNNLVAEYLARKFAELVPSGEEFRYKLTAAISEKFARPEPFDGLLYPALQMRGNADNVALKPRYADVALRFKRAQHARVDAVHDFSYDITVLDSAVALDAEHRFVWRGGADGWTVAPGGVMRFTVENGKWVARDVHGNVVEPQ
jgi:hypothetical protein